jgi:hypothetical protein
MRAESTNSGRHPIRLCIVMSLSPLCGLVADAHWANPLTRPSHSGRLEEKQAACQVCEIFDFGFLILDW